MEIRSLLIGYRPLNCGWIIMWEIGHVSRTIPLAFYFTIRKRSIGKRRKGNNNNKKKRGKWKECQKRGWRHGDPKYDAIDVTNNGIPNAANGGGEWKGGGEGGGDLSALAPILFPIASNGWVQISRGCSAAFVPLPTPHRTDGRLSFYSSFWGGFTSNP